MSPIRVTWGRTLGLARNLYTTALALGAFLSCAAVLFAFALEEADGGVIPIGAVWAGSVAPALPFLAAVLSMDVWSAERQTGRLEALLSVPVRERDLSFGKFMGVWTLVVAALLQALVVAVAETAVFAPAALTGGLTAEWGLGFLALAMQGALWSAVGLAVSAVFRHGAAAAAVTAILLGALPRCGWMALRHWAPQGSTAFGVLPLDAHVLDMACGVLSTDVVASYAILTVLALFIASKTIAASRLASGGLVAIRLSTFSVMLLAGVVAALAISLALRTDVTVELLRPVSPLSARTRGILAEAHGEVHATCFLSRSDPRHRRAAQLLRSFEREAAVLGGIRIVPHYVDATWDLGAAERLIGRGAKEGSIVFEYGRRMADVPLDEAWSERACASAVLRLVTPPSRRTVYWTRGHGEAAFDAYGPWGCSDIARELILEGYGNRPLSLTGDAGIPGDCALVVVSGAREDFSRAEVARLDAYLKQGGRVMVLLSSETAGGLASLLSAWGIRTVAAKPSGARSLSGTDVLADEFAEHPVSEPLTGAQVVFERPVAFEPSAAAGTGAGADRIAFTALAKAEGIPVAAVAELGGGLGSDLALRPTRLLVVGDASFVINAQLARRANANRDFFLNGVAYLSGTDATTAAGSPMAALATGLDRRERGRFLIVGALGVPLAVTLVMALFIAVRRRRG